jgi:hypothetical protein
MAAPLKNEGLFFTKNQNITDKITATIPKILSSQV